jgi:stage II sporulation protein GA (sporulation sigma-E factor processing peptidase)
MDLIIFYLSSKLLGVRVKCGRLLSGSFFSAVMYCVFIFTALQKYMGIVTAVLMLFISVRVVFKPKKWGELLFNSFCVTAVSFVVGGTALGIFYYINTSRGYAVSLNQGFPVTVLIISVSLAFLVIMIVKKSIKTNSVKKQMFCETIICVNGKRAVIKSLVDTGNSLTDPISGKPVIVADTDSLRDILPVDLYRLCKRVSAEETVMLSKNKDYIGKLRLIPFQSVGIKNGMLVGLVADSVVIDGIRENNVVVALSNISFSAINKYNAIVSPSYFELSGGYDFESGICKTYGGSYECV